MPLFIWAVLWRAREALGPAPDVCGRERVATETGTWGGGVGMRCR